MIRQAIIDHYKGKGLDTPFTSQTSVDLFKGLARIVNHKVRQVKALNVSQLIAILDLCPDSFFGYRDAAMLSLGFSAALRRSELLNLNVNDLVIQEHTAKHTPVSYTHLTLPTKA